MTILKNTILKTVSLLAVTILPGYAFASPTVEGNVIKWTEEGWHQVQLQSTYESVCNGGSQCTVPAGVYTVINHGTKERFMNIAVPNVNPSNSDLPRAPVTATGQVTSYAAGDDGDYQLGVTAIGQRFQDNGDGTFDDTLTGLTWLGVRDCAPILLWSSAINFANNMSASSGDCANLTDGSVAGDWRMPNIRELLSLMDYSVAFPAWEPSIPFTGNWLDDELAGLYWSSTSFKGSNPESTAYVLNSGVGLARAEPKNQMLQYVLPVRDSK